MFAIQSLPTSVIAFILEELSVQSFSLMRHQYGLLMVWGNEGDDGNDFTAGEVCMGQPRHGMRGRIPRSCVEMSLTAICIYII